MTRRLSADGARRPVRVLPRGLRVAIAVAATMALLGCAASAAPGSPGPGDRAAATSAAADPPIVESAFVRCVDADALASADPASGLDDPGRRNLAMMLVSSAENSTLRWEDQVGYLEYNVEGNDAENRGYTGGIVGFTSRTHDMLQLVEAYDRLAPGNPLAAFLPALRAVDGTASADGLGEPFEAAWRQAAEDPRFGEAQWTLASELYLDPAVAQAKTDGLGALGQFTYVDAIIVHGPGEQVAAFGGIRAAALGRASTPAQGGDEVDYLHAFLDVREQAMRAEIAHRDTTRVSTAQRRFLEEGNLALDVPLNWSVYGDAFSVVPEPEAGCS